MAKQLVLICGVLFDKQLKSGKIKQQELVSIAAQLGAQGIELREVYWQNKHRQIPLVQKTLAKTGMLATYATFTPLFNRNRKAQRRLVEDLEDAHTLGANLMRVFPGEWPVVPKDSQMWKAARLTIEKAASYGIKLALENYRFAPGNRWKEIYEAIQKINSPVMVVNIDTGNYILNGEDLMLAIKKLGPWVGYSHLKDVKQTPTGLGITYLGDGVLNFAEIIAAYDTLNRDFPLCLEFDGGDKPEESISKSLALLAALS